MSESAVKFSYSHLEDEFIREVISRGIEVRKDENRYIWFSSSRKSEIDEISDQVHTRPKYTGVIATNLSYLKLLEEGLENKGVYYKTIETKSYGDSNDNFEIHYLVTVHKDDAEKLDAFFIEEFGHSLDLSQ